MVPVTTNQYLYNGVNTIITYYTILYGVDIDYDIMGIAGIKYLVLTLIISFS